LWARCGAGRGGPRRAFPFPDIRYRIRPPSPSFPSALHVLAGANPRRADAGEPQPPGKSGGGGGPSSVTRKRLKECVCVRREKGRGVAGTFYWNIGKFQFRPSPVELKRRRKEAAPSHPTQEFSFSRLSHYHPFKMTTTMTTSMPISITLNRQFIGVNKD